MAVKQQRDYWRDVTRQGDVRYTVSWGDKDHQLLTPLHFNCQNKKLVQASCVFFETEEQDNKPSQAKTRVSRGGHVLGCQSGGLCLKSYVPQAQFMCGDCERTTPAPCLPTLANSQKT